MHRPVVAKSLATALAALLIAGCDGPQSALAPAAEEAARIIQLYWVMVAGSAVIWLLVIGIAIYATHFRPGAHPRAVVRTFLIGGGVAVPTLVLASLLAYGLTLLPERPAPVDGLRIVVTGERWWWRVRYEEPGREAVVLANEIALPVGETVLFELRSDDVIHAFWLPALAGKRDLIPGRVNRLTMRPRRIGMFRGTCAEYCGRGHANMGFHAEVMERAAFDDWLARQAAPAQPPAHEESRRGQRMFLERGCGNCHTVRGTAAQGRVGPDLTHVGSRRSIGAALLPMNHAALKRWIANAQKLKPGSRMPSFDLPPHELEALAAYLAQLQ